jgi:hypothetical protein
MAASYRGKPEGFSDQQFGDKQYAGCVQVEAIPQHILQSVRL